MTKLRFLALLLVGILGTTTVTWAASVDKLSIVKQGRYYITDAEFLVSVPQLKVIRAFTRFEDLSAINPAVVDSKTETLANNTTRVTTTLKDCVGLFCRSLKLVEDVTVQPEGTINSTMVPGVGDFSEGSTTWQFEPVGNQTRVRYHSRVQPGFWLPPLVGNRVMIKALTRQIVTAVTNLEAISMD